MHQIDRMTAIGSNPAVAPGHRLTYIPPNLNAANIVHTLAGLGLTIPTAITAAAAKGEPLITSRHKFSIKEIDGALSRADVSIADRFRLKTALSANGILEK